MLNSKIVKLIICVCFILSITAVVIHTNNIYAMWWYLLPGVIAIADNDKTEGK